MDPITDGWKVFRQGGGRGATRDELRRALVNVLNHAAKQEKRLAQIEPLAGPIEQRIRDMIEERIDALVVR